MADYTIDDATQELNHTEAALLSIVQEYLERRNLIEVARALVVVNKELYRLDEEARRLRLTGHLRLDIYRRLHSGYRDIASKISDASYKAGVAHEVQTIYRAIRFSPELAGIYLAEYLQGSE